MSIYFLMLLNLVVFFLFLNERYFRLQPTIVLMMGSLILSTIILFSSNVEQLDFLHNFFLVALSAIDFNYILMQWLLPYMLFAGSLHLDINMLKSKSIEIVSLSMLSTVMSTIFIAYIVFTLTNYLNINIDFNHCLIFGALISPTDPIAVLNVLKDLNSPKEISAKMAGESLFNDGIGIVLFIILTQLTYSGQAIDLNVISFMFLQKALGGSVFGVMLGLLMYHMIKNTRSKTLDILITIAGVSSGYVFAEYLDLSGPIAIVVSGIFIGNKGKIFFMSGGSRNSIDIFWEVVDDILNAFLFLLLGLELFIIDYKFNPYMIISSIIIVLFVRFITVAIPINLLKILRRPQPKNIIKILTWGGIRGGLAIALALSLPESSARNNILSMTYGIVVFSVLIQGTTIKYLLPKASCQQRRARL